MPTPITGRIPTEGELDRIYDQLQSVHDEIERVVWRLERITDAYDGEDEVMPDPLPTLADVGALHVFSHYLGMRAADFVKFQERLVDEAVLLDIIRREAPRRAARLAKAEGGTDA